jgi:hypothetical protein
MVSILELSKWRNKVCISLFTESGQVLFYFFLYCVSLTAAVDQLDASYLSRKSDMAMIRLLTCSAPLQMHYCIKIVCLLQLFVGQKSSNLNITFIKHRSFKIHLYVWLNICM